MISFIRAPIKLPYEAPHTVEYFSYQLNFDLSLLGALCHRWTIELRTIKNGAPKERRFHEKY